MSLDVSGIALIGVTVRALTARSECDIVYCYHVHNLRAVNSPQVEGPGLGGTTVTYSPVAAEALIDWVGIMSAGKRVVAVAAVFLAVVLYRIVTNPSLAVFSYIVVSYFKDFDNDVRLDNNYDGEVEDGLFTHRFIHLNETFNGMKVNMFLPQLSVTVTFALGVPCDVLVMLYPGERHIPCCRVWGSFCRACRIWPRSLRELESVERHHAGALFHTPGNCLRH